MKKSILGIIFVVLLLLMTGCTKGKFPEDEHPKEESSKDEHPLVIGLEVKSLPEKQEYYVDEELNFTGLEVYKLFSDNSKVECKDYTLSYDSLVTGQNEIKIHYFDYSCTFFINVIERPIVVIGLEIKSLPEKLEYFVDEKLDFAGLEVNKLLSDDSKVIYTDYTISYDELVLGQNEIEVSYFDYTCSFYITVIEKTKHLLYDYPDYSNFTTKSITVTDYSIIIGDVKYGGWRQSNTLVVYDKTNYYQTNIYGYEVAVNEFGVIVEKNVNVSLPENGFIISAIGTRAKEVKALSVGQFVLYNNSLFIYEKEEIIETNELYLTFEKIIQNLELIEDIDIYNQCVDELNALKSVEQSIKERLSQYQELYQRYKVDIDIYEHLHQYSVSEFNLSLMDYMNKEPNYLLYSTYPGTLYIGGFRNADTIVYYDASCYRERNPYGYEVAIDKNGIVIAMDILVDLPEGGYILSGHSSGEDFIKNNICMDDKIEIEEGIVSIYRDGMINLYNNSVTRRNDLVQEINEEIVNKIPHDYKYIAELLAKIDNALINNRFSGENLYHYQENVKAFTEINECLALIKALLIDSKVYQAKGMWYYPFGNSNYDDTSLEGVQATLLKLQQMGINEILVSTFRGAYVLHDSNIYQKYPQLEMYNYGEYGHDYLTCLITEAHKLDICVNAFTATFAEKISSLKEAHPEYFQIDFSGEKSMGLIYYYDICNDNVQKMLLDWYKELLTYDFDKVEYDIIRYSISNLSSFDNVEVITNPSKIVDPGYTTYSMNKFMKEYGYEGDLKELIINSKKVRNEWLQFKRDNLNHFVRDCTELMKSINPEIKVTAAVLSSYESANIGHLQDYKLWIENGYLDEVEPMLYTDSTAELQSKADPHFIDNPEYHVRMGLSVKLTDSDNYIDMEQIQIAEAKMGYILYCSNYYLADQTFVKLLSSNHHYQFVSCISSQEEIEKAIIDNIIDVVQNFYTVVNHTDYKELLTVLNTYQVNQIIEKINYLEDPLMKQYLLEQLNDYK